MKRPNILLITSDQQHWDTLGIDNPQIHTPALDRLCREGTRFKRAYCPNPTCTPTRASLLTGRMPSQHGAWSLGTKLQEDVPLMPQAMRDAGYYTALVGKAHFQPLANLPEYPSIESQPLLRDIDYWRKFKGDWYGFEAVETARMHADESHAGQHYAAWMEDKGFNNWRDFYQDVDATQDEGDAKRSTYTVGDPRHWSLPEDMHYTPWTAERTIAQMEVAVSREQSFYVWSSFHDPHPPYIVPEPWASLYDPNQMNPGVLTPGEHENNPPHFAQAAEIENPDYWQRVREGEGCVHGGRYQGIDPQELKKDVACYYGMTSFMDHHIGRILDWLEEKGLAENTLLVFTTDHGHFIGQHGLTQKAIHHYEDLLRVPFVVRYPGRIPRNMVSDDIQNLVDLPRTFMREAGVPALDGMQGVDQMPSWTGEGKVREWSITENYHGYENFHMDSLVTERYKLTVYRNGDRGELFDLEKDPDEVHNRWDDPEFGTIKGELLLLFVQARMQDEPTYMPRIAPA